VIAYIESNFVIELAFRRDDYESCQFILDLARNNKILLVIPSFSISEPYEAWVRRSKERAKLQDDLMRQIKEISRSEVYQDFPDRFDAVTESLIDTIEVEKRGLDQALQDILACVEVIPIDVAVIRAAVSNQSTLGLGPQDSIVYASVLSHLSRADSGPKCFLNKNSKDFLNPELLAELEVHECRLITSFRKGLNHIEAELRHVKP